MTMKDFFEMDIGSVKAFVDDMNNWADAISKDLIGLYIQQPTDTMLMSDGVALLRQEYLKVGDSLRNYIDRLNIVFGLLQMVTDTMNNWADATVVNRISEKSASVGDSLNSWNDNTAQDVNEVSNCFF